MEGYQLEIVIDNHMAMQVGKLYRVMDRVMSIPVYERVHYNYPDPNEDYYLTVHDDRLVDWYDPTDKEWGYKNSQNDLRPGDIFMILEINHHVLHAWSGICRPHHVGIRFLKGDVSGWLYQPIDSPSFKEIA